MARLGQHIPSLIVNDQCALLIQKVAGENSVAKAGWNKNTNKAFTTSLQNLIEIFSMNFH